jgi:5-(carboxyamino)imidazole ribonucleotide synthase
MTYQAGISLGVTVRLLATAPDESAALVGADVEIGAPADAAALAAFAAGCDVTTFDHELVDTGQVARLEAQGRRFYPTAATMALAQNKRRQRAELGALGFPVPPHQVVREAVEIAAFAEEHGWPVVVKASRGGYDGRGVWVIEGETEAGEVCREAQARGLELIVETFVPIEREVAVLVARRPGGEAVVYPVVETVQRDGICHELLVPARITDELAAEARRIGCGIAAAIGAVGILAVELFVADGAQVVNEIAARPHNSGHFSIEGAVTSQFQNHLRAVLDWPLGRTDLVCPAVATANVLGESTVNPHVYLPAALAVPGAGVHLYGKSARPGRKLGHVTCLGADVEEARERARRAAGMLVRGA